MIAARISKNRTTGKLTHAVLQTAEDLYTASCSPNTVYFNCDWFENKIQIAFDLLTNSPSFWWVDEVVFEYE